MDRMQMVRNKVPFLFRPGSLLYVGARADRFELGPELAAAGREITLVEIWPENVEYYRQHLQHLQQAVRGDVREIDRLGLGMFEASVWWHGPEHIERAELRQTINRLERVTEGVVVLGCPWGQYEQGPMAGNPYEEHRAALYQEDFENLGYETTTLGQIDEPGSMILAWKWLRPKAASPTIPHVVMVTHADRRQYLEWTIPAVLDTDWPLTLTVIANGPSEASEAYLRGVEKDLYRLVVWKTNRGKPKAANRGWKLRDADYTVLLDDDVLVVDRDWLRKLVDIADRCPQAGMIGHSYEAGAWPVRTLGSGDKKRIVQVQPSNVNGGCVLIPRRTVERCGYYNEELPFYGETDGLYGWKVRQAGLLCVYFDYSELGRSVQHLDRYEDPEYNQFRAEQREKALLRRAELERQYTAGRRLNT